MDGLRVYCLYLLCTYVSTDLKVAYALKYPFVQIKKKIEDWKRLSHLNEMSWTFIFLKKSTKATRLFGTDSVCSYYIVVSNNMIEISQKEAHSRLKNEIYLSNQEETI